MAIVSTSYKSIVLVFFLSLRTGYFAFWSTALIGLHKIIAGAMHHRDYGRLTNSRILKTYSQSARGVCAFRYFRMNQFPGACKIYAIFIHMTRQRTSTSPANSDRNERQPTKKKMQSKVPPLLIV